jgi:DNA-binding transcriptional MerR regulator
VSKNHFLLNEVARQVGCQPYQIAYRITTGVFPEPELRINNKRVFTAEDVEAIKMYFQKNAVREGKR